MSVHQSLRKSFHQHMGFAGYGFLRFIAKSAGKKSEDLEITDLPTVAKLAEKRLVNVMAADDLSKLIAEIRALRL